MSGNNKDPKGPDKTYSPKDEQTYYTVRRDQTELGMGNQRNGLEALIFLCDDPYYDDKLDPVVCDAVYDACEEIAGQKDLKTGLPLKINCSPYKPTPTR